MLLLLFLGVLFSEQTSVVHVLYKVGDKSFWHCYIKNLPEISGNIQICR